MSLRDAPERSEYATTSLGFGHTPRLDAELLMAHALGLSREALFARLRDAPAPAGSDAPADRRAAHEPIAYITGTRDLTISLAVAPRQRSWHSAARGAKPLIEAAFRVFRASPTGKRPRTIVHPRSWDGIRRVAACGPLRMARSIRVGIDASDLCA
ncbi:MAG: hypothetical protein IPO97_10190 [Sphingomonadales bacterium]|nr:hypothetical protein [Sphingomonadales bacterium]